MSEHPTITELRKLRKPSDRSVELVRLTESTAAAKAWVAQSALAAPHLLAEVDALRAQLAAARVAVAMRGHDTRCGAFWDRLADCGCGQREARLALGLEVTK